MTAPAALALDLDAVSNRLILRLLEECRVRRELLSVAMDRIAEDQRTIARLREQIAESREAWARLSMERLTSE